MRTTLDLPDGLFRELKARAALRGMKMKDLLTELIAAGLRAPSADAAPPQRSPLPTPRRAVPGRQVPARSNAELHHILDEEDAQLYGDQHAGR